MKSKEFYYNGRTGSVNSSIGVQINDWLQSSPNIKIESVYYASSNEIRTALVLYDLINKPVETTNEQPKEKYNLQTWLEDQKDETLIYFRNNGKDAEIQLCGMSIYLKPDGTYILTDTTGG